MKKLIQGINRFIRRLSAIINTPAPRPEHYCGNINALLLHLCDFDHALHMWVLRWLAFPLQNPGAKMSTCLLINGGEGTGKKLIFAKVMAALYGDSGRVVGTNALHPRARGWIDRAKFVVVEGSYSDQSISHLKHLISAPQGYIDAVRSRPAGTLVRNQMNLVFLTGSLDFLPLDAASRRFVVVEAPPAREPRFYRAVADEINNGGIAAFREYLLTGIDLAGFNAQTLPPAACLPAAQLREAA